jgi:hypothetical protein
MKQALKKQFICNALQTLFFIRNAIQAEQKKTGGICKKAVS